MVAIVRKGENLTTPAALVQPNVLPELASYLEVTKTNFVACCSNINHSITVPSLIGDISFHYVKFDPTTKEPKFSHLAKALAKHIVRYCLSASTRQAVRSRVDFVEDEGELFILARDYFRKIAGSGEVGELLLFFLLEAAIGAPQVVCKMELKTNPKDEIKGSDGVHIRWDEIGNHLDVYIGESKLYKDIGSAMSDALRSVEALYNEDRVDRELHLVTSHFKHLDDAFKAKVTAWLNRDAAPTDCHIIHSCLIGWDWSEYSRLANDRDALFVGFEEKYKDYCSNIQELLTRRFASFPHTQLSFHFLFVPFISVSEFREAFYRALLGG